MIPRIETLLNCLGIDSSSFENFLEWALSEQLVISVAKSKSSSELRVSDGLKRFRNDLRTRTGRDWSEHDLVLLYGAVKGRLDQHYRDPIAYSEYLRLLWNEPHECKICRRRPPEIKLHIDHIVPVSLGGKSNGSNIQFLCQDCNQKKSNKLTGGEPWLDLR